MATVINTPGTNDNSSGIGFIIGAIVLLAVFFFIFAFGLPAMKNAAVPAPQAPAQQEAPAVNIPDQIDVNIDTPQGGQNPQ